MKVSVIVPAYNAEHYLRETVASVQAQTYANWELVIVNDGSKDGTGALADRLAAEDARIQVVHQENAGLSGARNSGLTAAFPHAQYLLFLDADDVLEPAALDTLASLLTDHPAAPAAYGLARYINSEGQAIRLNEAEEFGRLRRSVQAGRLVTHPAGEATNFSMLVYRNVILTPGMVLLRKAALEQAGAFDTKMSPTADWDMWLRIARQGGMLLTNSVVLSYRRHEHNMSGSGQSMRAAEMMMRIKAFQHLDLTAEQRHDVLNGFRRSERESAVQWWKGAWSALLRGRRREALWSLRIAAKYYRWSLGTPTQGEKFSG